MKHEWLIQLCLWISDHLKRIAIYYYVYAIHLYKNQKLWMKKSQADFDDIECNWNAVLNQYLRQKV